MLNAAQAQGSLPPSYSILDTGNPEGKLATEVGQMIKSRCLDFRGAIDHQKVRRVLDMVVTYIKDETGVLPSSVTTSTINTPANDNPTNPDEWDWSKWATCHLPRDGMRGLAYTKRIIIGQVLGGATGKDVDKVCSLLEHDLFKETVGSHISPISVKNIVRSAKSCSDIFDGLFREYEPRQYFSPVGMIRAAIALGYLSRDEIQQLYAMKLR